MKTVISNSIPDELKYLASIINRAGYRFYIVGGFVRDIFLGSCSTYENDIDVCGDCTPDIFAELISDDSQIKLCEANFPLGTLKLIIGQLDIEYTCFRTESYRGDGFHTPSNIVFTKDMLKDAMRRDFTINALYLDPLTCEVTDFFNGQKDIKLKQIKTVRESKEVFTEDALRILRMCRFAAKLGFDIDKNTMAGAKECASLLKNISKERIGAELDKILYSAQYTYHGIDAIYKSKINDIICSNITKPIADKVPSAKKDRYIRWAVFLSNMDITDAEKYILDLSLGKELAKEVRLLIANAKIYNQNNDKIIINFAKFGQEKSKRQIEYIYTFYPDKAEYLDSIYTKMVKNSQFISFDELAIDGNAIMEILNAKGKDIKTYKEKAYEYAILNPNKNNYHDLVSFLKS